MRRMLALLLVVTVWAGVVPSASAAPRYASSVRAVTAQDLGASWRSGCPVGPAALRMVQVSHWGFDGAVRTGRLVVHVDQVPAVIGLFGQLFALRFPIERMVPVDAYGGDDDASMADNNTSGFNCRRMTGGSAWSRHAYGWAVDVNPVQNPYVSGSTVLPPAGRQYLDRSNRRKGMITAGDNVVRAFGAVGYAWGGAWHSPKDYQHFEAREPVLVRPAPSLSSPAAGTLTQVRRSAADAVETRTWRSGAWSPWRGAGGQVFADPAVVSWSAARRDVFAVGRDGALWHRSSGDAGVTWGAWQSLGGTLTSGPSAVSTGPGRLDVVARGTDGAVWRRSWGGTSWSPWTSLGGSVTGRPEIASSGAGRLHVLARGQNRAVWMRTLQSGGWTSWATLGGDVTSHPAAVGWGGDRLDVVVRGTDGAVWTRAWTGAGWTGWTSLGGTTLSAPEVVSTSPGALDVFAVGSNGRTYVTSLSGGRWSGYRAVPD